MPLTAAMHLTLKIAKVASQLVLLEPVDVKLTPICPLLLQSICGISTKFPDPETLPIASKPSDGQISRAGEQIAFYLVPKPAELWMKNGLDSIVRKNFHVELGKFLACFLECLDALLLVISSIPTISSNLCAPANFLKTSSFSKSFTPTLDANANIPPPLVAP